jgi:hypothetical protein
VKLEDLKSSEAVPKVRAKPEGALAGDHLTRRQPLADIGKEESSCLP